MSLRINELLKERDKTQKWLAEQLDITEPGVNLIIKERVNVPLRRLEQIAQILEVNIIELFDDYKTLGKNCTNKIRCPYCDKEIELTISAK